MLDHSTAPQRSRWPNGPATLSDEFTIRVRNQSVRVKHRGATLLVRRRISELGMSKEQLCEATGLSPSMAGEIVHRGRDLRDHCETLERVLQIEPGRLLALEGAATNDAARTYARVLQTLRDTTENPYDT